MQVLREIYKAETDRVSIRIPQSFLHQNLEIIIFPIKDVVDRTKWPVDFFEKTAGSFSETPLVRGAQGKFEMRERIK